MRVVLIGLVVVVAVGNLAIFVAVRVARAGAPSSSVAALPGVKNLRAVDEHLWRGAAPTPEGYRALARHEVTTIVDLRAERDLRVDEAMLAGLGMDLVRIPLRDGQAPGPAQVASFLDVVRRSPGRVFVHCGGGVGRTGSMSAAYLVTSGGATPSEALSHNLSVGPPSLEQIAFVAGLDAGGVRRPGFALTAVSRVLDAPRRLWARLT